MDSTILEDLLLPFSEEPTSPVKPKLKRLKKAYSEKKEVDPFITDLQDLELKKEKFNQVVESEHILPDSVDPLFPESGGLIEELRKGNLNMVIESESLLPDSVEEELESIFPESGGLMEELRKEKFDEMTEEGQLDPLFPEPSGLIKELRKARNEETRVRVSESPLMDDSDGLDPLFPKSGEYKAWEGEEIGEDGLIEGLKKEKSAKKRLNLDIDDEIEEKETKKKKKVITRKSGKNGDSKSKESAREKRKYEKERKVALDNLHAETQRLLRETNEASFKPNPVAHKPISSVLEKIRLRKMQILKESSISLQTESFDVTESSIGVNLVAQNMKNNDMDLKMADTETNLDDCENGDNENASRKSEENENQSGINADNTETENIIPPSMPISSPDNDSSSSSSEDEEDEEEEEYNDKENINPFPHKILPNKTLNPKPSFPKEFLDDEAEEEDDSDHDLMRFEENEDSEEDESGENEILNDLIATGFKEGKKDKEIRNKLHLKWMAEEDENQTKRVLNKLKFGHEEKDEEVLSDENEEDEEEEDENMEEEKLGFEKKSVLESNRDKLKKTMIQMFDNDDNAWVHSDEEETEESLLLQRLSFKKAEDCKIISPLEDDEQSREVFGLIRNLKIAPPKRAKQATSNLNMLTLGGNNIFSSKSSFIGRKTSGPLPSSRKCAMSRAFIFGRDVSRSSDTQNSSDIMDVKEDSEDSNKPSLAKSSSSQFKAPSFNSNSKVNFDSNSSSSSNSSLFEKLRQSSRNSGKKVDNSVLVTETQAAYHFSSFKLTRRFSRVEGKN